MELADSCQSSSTALSLVRRETNFDNLINLLQSSFKQTFTTNAFLASLGTSFGISALMMATWILVRPYHSNVYAPKLRHADKDRAPPAIDKGFFSWLNPLIKCHEMDLVDKIGMDATIFLRFMRMCRSLFCVLAILGCAVMIPVNVTCSQKNGRTAGAGWGFDKYWYTLMSPSYTFGSCMWAHVIVAWVFDMIIMYFLWSNYREVVKLRRHYFESQEYVDSLHSRTLMVWHIPDTSRSEEGLGKLVSGKGIELDGRETVAIARNMKNLPELLDMHNAAVRSLEKIIAKYFKDPDNVPTTRPVCRPSKDDHSMDKKTQVDAIEYYRNRIAELEKLIAITRRGIDKRETLPYGFVSFPTISRAHITGKALRGKHPKGSSIKLASKPYDIIWDSLNRNKSSRRWNRIIGNVLFTLLSILYVIPNACIAVFLSNLNNIAIVWPEFATTLNGNPKFFAIVQGILAPTITSCVYLLLPVLMRRISAWQGDITKSQRERHVTHKLYVFFIINNFIVFALFGMLWSTVRDFVGTVQDHGFNWDGIEYLHVGNRIALALFDISTFWITYILQRNLGAILDLVQIVTLISNTFSARFLSPTPRQKIEWTAPPPFDYATYYNYFLFYSTIALCFSTIQPLVLPVTFFYFFIDSFLKKYTLMYVFVSKIESGGTFWRMIFNRILFATFMFNMVVSLVVWSRYTGKVACYVLPLPFVLILFKIYCHRTMDMDTRYYTRGSDRDSILGTGALDKPDRLAKRYCHPALHQQLIRPMVPGKAEHLMAGIYGTTHERGIGLDNLEPSGKKKKPTAGFEVVQEEDMDFANFKHRAEFGQDHGGGAMYGDEFSTMGGGSATGSPGSSRPGSPGMAPMVMSDSPHPYGYRGVDYSRMPSYQQRPDSVDYSNMDTRSDIGSVTNLLAGQQNYQPHQHSGLNPAQEQEHLIQQQQYHEQQQQYPEQQYQQQQQQYSEQQYQQQQNQQQQNQQQHPYQHPPTQQTWPHNEGYEGYRGAGPRQ